MGRRRIVTQQDLAEVIAGRLTGNSRASSPTANGPSIRRVRMLRRVASPSATVPLIGPPAPLNYARSLFLIVPKNWFSGRTLRHQLQFAFIAPSSPDHESRREHPPKNKRLRFRLGRQDCREPAYCRSTDVQQGKKAHHANPRRFRALPEKGTTSYHGNPRLTSAVRLPREQ